MFSCAKSNQSNKSNKGNPVRSKASKDKLLRRPVSPMKARVVNTFPLGKEWMYEPKWDGFRCLVFPDNENIFFKLKAGKRLTSAFPEIVEAFRALMPKHFVLVGNL